MSDLSGKTFGPYSVLEKVAVGGMAEVYMAVKDGGEPVAIKAILPSYASEEQFVAMFLDEARLVSGLDHQNIVSVLDFGKVADTYFLAMEWVDGKPLSKVIQRQLELNLEFPVDAALFWAVDTLSGLAYAHRTCDGSGKTLGLVHRDVSPPNILINRDGVAKLTDFGIAYAKDKAIKTMPGIIRGKLSYMSPEQARGLRVDRRSDIFAVGILLFEMLSSRRLFLRGSEIETLEAVRECNVPDLTSLRPEIPQAVEAAVRRALAAEPNDRFSVAEEMASEIRQAMYRSFPDADRQHVRQFLKDLFPIESFTNVHRPSLRSLAVWTESRRHTMAPERVFKDRLRRNRYYLALGLGVLALLAAEAITWLSGA